MRVIIIILSFLFLSTPLIGQNNFDPKVVVLLPRVVEIEKGLEKKIEFYEEYGVDYQKEYLIEKKDSLLQVVLRNDSIPNSYKEHFINQIDFAPKLNFVNSLVWNYTESFQGILSLDFEKPLVIAGANSSFSDIELMNEFSQKNNADYLINIDSLIVSKYKRDILVKPVFTIYYQNENRVIRIDPYEYDQFNKAYITVDKKTLNIFFDDLDARSKILRIIKENGDSNKREELKTQKIIEEKRINILDSLFNKGKSIDELEGFNKDSILNTPISSLYTIIYSTNKDKCLAFFVIKKKWDYEGFGGVNDEINVIYCKKEGTSWVAEYQQLGSIKINELSQEENVKESFLKLIDMEFFEENSTKLNNDFWNNELFKESRIKF